MPIVAIKDDREYILSKSIPEPNSGCWIWLGAINSDGYGTGWRPEWEKPSQLAHRISYQAFSKNLKCEDVVAHLCDNPSCCNPEHLKLCSQKENMQDASAKKRIAFGERAGKAKLNWNSVNDIRSSSKGVSDLAREYGVNEKTIYDVLKFNSWKVGTH